MSDKYPDVVHLIERMRGAGEGAGQGGAPLELEDFIMDAELVAVDRAQDNRLLAFQALSTRGR
jgi:ATP-dependent DNA ligase